MVVKQNKQKITFFHVSAHLGRVLVFNHVSAQILVASYINFPPRLDLIKERIIFPSFHVRVRVLQVLLGQLIFKFCPGRGIALHLEVVVVERLKILDLAYVIGLQRPQIVGFEVGVDLDLARPRLVGLVDAQGRVQLLQCEIV